MLATNHNGDKRQAYNMTSRFKRDDKFSGKFCENVNKVLGNNMQAANDYDLNQSQELSFFQNLLDGEAKQFFATYVQPVCTSFTEACPKIYNDRTSIARQISV